MAALSNWICDTCGELISSPEKGLIVWNTDTELQKHSFHIAHKGKCDDRSFQQSLGLGDLLGLKGQAHLLSFLSYGPLINSQGRTRLHDIDEFVDLFRRLQTPWYEEARSKFRESLVVETGVDANEVYPYLPDSLKRIAESGSDS
jgi:hypothetical protein